MDTPSERHTPNAAWIPSKHSLTSFMRMRVLAYGLRLADVPDDDLGHREQERRDPQPTRPEEVAQRPHQ